MEIDRSILNDTLEHLGSVREKVHSNVEDSVLEELDQAIMVLETAGRDGSPRFSAQDLLVMIGVFLDLMPFIANLINRLR